MIRLRKKAKLLMAALSIGSHYSPSYQFKKRSFRTPSVYSLPSLGSSLWRIKGPRLIRNGVLARADDKAGGSSSPSLPRQQGVESKNEKQLELMKTSLLDFEAAYQPKTDLTGTLAINLSWVTDNQDIAMALLFAIGHVGIIFEESLAFNKSGVGLLMAVNLWVVRSIGAPSSGYSCFRLKHASAEVSEIVFFLLGAMTIVEIVDAHQGCKLVTDI